MVACLPEWTAWRRRSRSSSEPTSDFVASTLPITCTIFDRILSHATFVSSFDAKCSVVYSVMSETTVGLPVRSHTSVCPLENASGFSFSMRQGMFAGAGGTADGGAAIARCAG